MLTLSTLLGLTNIAGATRPATDNRPSGAEECKEAMGRMEILAQATWGSQIPSTRLLSRRIKSCQDVGDAG